MKLNCLFITVMIFMAGFGVLAQGVIHVDGSKILSACDEEIIMRGVNEMFIWSSADKMGATTLPEIAKTGANTVRLVWTTDGEPSEFEQLIENCLANNMIPVAELHDATGDFSQLQKLLDYWKLPAVLEIIEKHKDWLIVNIGNEIGQGETNDQWEAYYKDAITQLRNAGIDAPLMIDCGDYGSNEQYFLAKGESLLAHDPLHNIIFSVHTYWINPDSDQGRMNRLDDLITEAKTKNLPFIIGEGPQKAASPWSTYCEVDFPYVYLMKRCQEEGIGWLAWSWGLVDNNDCGAPNSVFDITTDGIYGNWSSEFGEVIMLTDPNSIKNTSIIPVSLINGNCGQLSCSPIELTQSEQELCVDGEVVLTVSVPFSASKNLSWYHNDELINESGLTISVANGGDYRVEVDSANVCTVVDELRLDDLVEVEISGETEICVASTTELSVNVIGANYELSWFENGEEIMEWKGQYVVNANHEGTYVAKQSTEFCEGEDEVEIISWLPNIGDTVICKNTAVTLTVKGESNSVWYGDATLTEELYIGNDYVVNQNEMKTYYIQDQGGFSGRVGKEEPGQSVWDTWDEESKQHKLGFEVFEMLTVKTMDVYAQSGGSLNVVFFDADKVELETQTFVVSAGKNELMINKAFSPGVYYANVAGSGVNVKLNHDEGNYTTDFPYVLMNGSKKLLSIDRTDESWLVAKPWYLFFYNWEVVQEGGATCVAKEITVDVTDNCITGSDESKDQPKVSIYPNPFSSELNLSIAQPWELVNVSGQVVLVGNGNQIQTTSLPSGVYWLKIEDQFYRVTK